MKFLLFLSLFFIGTSLNAQSVYQKAMADKEPVYEVTDEVATFPGGDAAMLRFINETMKYPTSAKAAKVEGRVVMQILVEKDGRVTLVNPVVSPDEALTEETVRLTTKMPNWNPAKKDGQPVRSYIILPVQYKL
jgi:periplasmic protein TonB